MRFNAAAVRVYQVVGDLGRLLRAAPPGGEDAQCAFADIRNRDVDPFGSQFELRHGPIVHHLPTGFNSVPTPETVISRRSPWRRYRLGLRLPPVPSGEPVAMMSPGKSVVTREI